MGRVLLFAGILIVLAAPAASAEVPLFNTTRMYSEAEFTAAIKPYADGIARNANDTDAHHWLGIAYLHAFKLYKFGLAPYAGGFGGRAVASLERSVQLKADPAVMLALAEAYIVVGAFNRWASMTDRQLAAAPPLPVK